MISYIKGELAEVLEDSIVVETGGIGFEIRVPALVLDELPAEGEEVKIYTYFHVREDAMQLFGFLERSDIRIFEQLLGVSGIGPKGAMAILSIMSAEDLQFAVLADDAKTISKAPGVGLKTAQKLILELKDKMKLEEAFELKAKKAEKQKQEPKEEMKEEKPATTKKTTKKSTEPKKKENTQAKNDAILALEALGYTPAEALKAVRQIEDLSNMTTDQIIKEALKNLL